MPTLKISNTVTLDENEVEFSAIRAQGSGGQKVNKVVVAVHLYNRAQVNVIDIFSFSHCTWECIMVSKGNNKGCPYDLVLNIENVLIL